jgi:hypothetical protein
LGVRSHDALPFGHRPNFLSFPFLFEALVSKPAVTVNLLAQITVDPHWFFTSGYACQAAFDPIVTLH